MGDTVLHVGDIVMDTKRGRKAIVFVLPDEKEEMPLLIYKEQKGGDSLYYTPLSELSFIGKPDVEDIELLCEVKNQCKNDVLRRYAEEEWDYRTMIDNLQYYGIL